MNSCLILGGGGYIGSRWGARLAKSGRFQRIILADLRPPAESPAQGSEFFACDVRLPLGSQVPKLDYHWIFNFAAVHREPGHAPREYFDTNIAGARNVAEFAGQTGCPNILFTSSIAVYGPTTGPASEKSPMYPATPYGITKFAAELIHEGWWRAAPGRRLLICRPGVIYGPGDPGNILRMIKAVKKGRFSFPGRRDLRKSYGYIEGLLDSFEFAMDHSASSLTFNYVESETETLGRMVEIVQAHFGKHFPVISLPLPLLITAASVIQLATNGKSGFHPVRVRKAATSTHIIPATLQKLGFPFRYGFKKSLEHWAATSPEDFN